MPAAPRLLTGTPGNAQASLSWLAVVGAASYSVKRATTNVGPFVTIASALTSPSYVDRQVTNATTYYYVVSAVNSAGESPNSAGFAVTPQAPLTPPTALTAAATSGRVNLTWKNPAGVFVVQNYVYRATHTTGPFTMIAVLQPTTHYTDTTVRRGTTYTYAVTAVSSVGQESRFSNAATVTAR